MLLGSAAPRQVNACGENIGLSDLPLFECFQRLNTMEHLSSFYTPLVVVLAFVNWNFFFFFNLARDFLRGVCMTVLGC